MVFFDGPAENFRSQRFFGWARESDFPGSNWAEKLCVGSVDYPLQHLMSRALFLTPINRSKWAINYTRINKTKSNIV